MICADALTSGMHLYLFVILSQRLSILKSGMLTGSEFWQLGNSASHVKQNFHEVYTRSAMMTKSFLYKY